MLCVSRCRPQCWRLAKGFGTSSAHYNLPAACHSANESRVAILNSLTKSKVPLAKHSDRPLKWYSCGPTVYDASHIGHARNYVSQDIIRRVLTNYFGYDLHFVMNVTDIDDKIIARTREAYFTERFSREHTQLSQEMIYEVNVLLCHYVRTHISDIYLQLQELEHGSPSVWQQLLNVLEVASPQPQASPDEKRKMHIASVRQCVNGLIASQLRLDTGVEDADREGSAQLLQESADILGPTLNAQRHLETIDPGLYSRTAELWESRFFNDMSRLNVLSPDTVTRASGYISEVVQFIQGILENGYGYASGGSVYFDTTAFIQSGKHQYNKLLNNAASHQDTQANSAASVFTKHKKTAADFSLWKAAKNGEPSWPSPWGPGRPGWHIECSAMASSIFGDKMDIHSGGIDLLFPHHTNELAQSEAYHGCKDWVDCFIHIGHLHVEGSKMSKSLKNFITIENILERYTPRQLRLAFLMRSWASPLHFSEAIMTQEVVPLEAFFNNFFAHVAALSGDASTFKIGHSFGSKERDLRSNFDAAQVAFRRALEDSIDTPSAMSALRNLISSCNIYMNQNPSSIDGLLILGISRWITQMLQMFGVCTYDESRIGWEMEASMTQQTTTTLLPYLQAVSTFRDKVRTIAKSKSPLMAKELLALCDDMRNDVLPSLGVQLTDRVDGPALIKFVAAKRAEQMNEAGHPRSTPRENSYSADLDPKTMFKPPHVPLGRYSSWDESGVPLTDAENAPLSKSSRKKLRQQWKLQMDTHCKNQPAN